MSDKKLYTKMLVTLDLLNEPGARLRDRILLLYSLMGSRPANKHHPAWVQVWKAKDICKVIGHVEEDGEPSGTQVESVSRIRRDLIAEGRLVEVSRMYSGGVWGYGHAYVPQNSMSAEALALLNERSTGGRLYCNPKDRLALMMAENLDKLPEVAAITFAARMPGAQWDTVLSSLADFSMVDAWEFWTAKAPATLNARDHPMRRFEDKNVRLQVGLASLEKLLMRNVKSNRKWKPDSHVAWALNTLKRSVGRERDATLTDAQVDAVLGARQSATRWLRDLALETCEALPSGTTNTATAKPHVSPTSPVDGQPGENAQPPVAEPWEEGGDLDALLDAYPEPSGPTAGTSPRTDRDVRRQMLDALRAQGVPGLAGLVRPNELALEVEAVLADASTIDESARRLATMHGGTDED